MQTLKPTRRHGLLALAAPVGWRIALGFAAVVFAAPLAAQGVGTIRTVAGTGVEGFSGDGGPAAAAQINAPYSIAVDSSGNLYINGSNRIRKVDVSTGIISTVAGMENGGFAGDGGPATAARLWNPLGVAVDSADNLYIADSSNQRIRRVDARTGNISTLAGTGTQGSTGDGGPAIQAALESPEHIAVDSAGNLYVADFYGHRIRRVDIRTGGISTVAGTGTPGFSGDGGRATSAQIHEPTAVALDSAGNLYIVDSSNHRIRRVDNGTGNISTVAGTGSSGFSGDGGPATSARLNLPEGVVADGAGNLYIADSYNHRVRRVDAGTGIISTVAGTGSSGFSGDGGPATSAALHRPGAVAVDGNGNLYIADTLNRRIRVVSGIAVPRPGGGSDVPENRPPVATGSFTNLNLGIGQSSSITLADKFRDPEGGVLTYSVQSSDAAVASARAVDGALLVESLSQGIATVTVRAFDAFGQSARQSFRVFVGGLVLTFDSPVFSAPEGGTLRLGLSLGQPADAALSVPWTARPDGDPATADADAEDLGVLGGTVTFAAGETEALVEIPVTDDSDIELAREFLQVALAPPPEGADYILGLGEATLEVQEGVCDRTPAVRDALRGPRECWEPTSADLAARRYLALNRRGISSLRPKDFLELSGLRALHLEGNRLSSLPEGLFAGITELYDLNLSDNPGTPFPLVMRLVRTDAEPWAPGPAQVEARVAQGAPLALTAEVQAEGAELSVASATIPAGALASPLFQAAPTAAGAARLSLSAPAAVPAERCGDPAEGPEGLRPCFHGLAPQAGPPLILFRPAPIPTDQPPMPKLSADGDRASIALAALFSSTEAGGRLDYQAESDRPELVVARIADGALVLEANEDGTEGTALVTLTATTPDGLSVSLSIAVTVEVAPRGGLLRGWRLEWLRSLSEATQ